MKTVFIPLNHFPIDQYNEGDNYEIISSSSLNKIFINNYGKEESSIIKYRQTDIFFLIQNYNVNRLIESSPIHFSNYIFFPHMKFQIDDDKDSNLFIEAVYGLIRLLDSLYGKTDNIMSMTWDEYVDKPAKYSFTYLIINNNEIDRIRIPIIRADLKINKNIIQDKNILNKYFNNLYNNYNHFEELLSNYNKVYEAALSGIEEDYILVASTFLENIYCKGEEKNWDILLCKLSKQRMKNYNKEALLKFKKQRNSIVHKINVQFLPPIFRYETYKFTPRDALSSELILIHNLIDEIVINAIDSLS